MGEASRDRRAAPVHRLTSVGALAAAVLLAACAAAPQDETLGEVGPGTGPLSNKPEQRDTLSFFGGATKRGASSEATYGVAYEREIVGLGGFGGILESTPDGRDFLFVAPALYLHPHRRLAFVLGPGMQFESSESAFLWRTGARVTFPLWRGLGLVPQVYYDIAEGHDSAFVYGVALSIEF